MLPPHMSHKRRIWAYWISPFAYLLRSIVINEMTSPHWDIPSGGTTLGLVRQTLGMGLPCGDANIKDGPPECDFTWEFVIPQQYQTALPETA